MKGIGKNSKSKKQNRDKSASDRFRKITERAKIIREQHPKMKWKNCVKQASNEMF